MGSLPNAEHRAPHPKIKLYLVVLAKLECNNSIIYVISGDWGYVRMRKKELCCNQRHYIHILLYIMSLATSWMIGLLTTHKILNKRRIKGLVYRTRSYVIFIGPGLLGICVYNMSLGGIFSFWLAAWQLKMRHFWTEICLRQHCQIF